MAQMKTDTNTQAGPMAAADGTDLWNSKDRLAKSREATVALPGPEESDMDGQKKKLARRTANEVGRRVAASFIAQAIWKVLLWLMDQ